MHDCLHAPSAVVNLISVGRLVDHGFACTFGDSHVTIHTPLKAGRAICYQHRLTNHLGVVNIKFVHLPESCSSMLCSSPSGCEFLAFAKAPVTRDLWHARFGHAGESAVKLLTSSSTGMSLPAGPFSMCKACIVGKHVQHPHPPSSSHASCPLELVHTDVCGPFPMQTPHGKLYLDNYSHTLSLQLLASKDQALNALHIIHPC
jgi:hypothetical protein